MHQLTRSKFTIAAFAIGVAVAGRAEAHAPPEATGIVWYHGGEGAAARSLNVVRTNRGLIVSEDGGATFRLLCNDAFQASLTEVAPLAFAGDGRLLVASYAGGLQSTGDLCGFTAVPGPLGKANVVGVESSGAGKPYFVIASSDDTPDHLFASTDDGKTWTSPSVVEDFVFTLKAAPSDAKRLYASTLHVTDGGAAYRVLVSSDGGLTFAAHEPGIIGSQEIGIGVLGVDPSEPARAFVRMTQADPTLPERVLRTDDGGAHFAEALSALGPTYFAANADGSTMWLGGADGLFRSTDHGKTFSRLPGAGVSLVMCLAFHEGALYACAYSGTDFGVLKSSDGGGVFAWYLRFPDVKTQFECPAGSQGQTLCADRFHDWELEQQGLILPDGGLPSSARGGAPGAAGNGSAGGAPVPGGATGFGGASTGSGGRGASDGENPHGRSSGSCAVAPVRAGDGSSRGVPLLVVAGGALWRRRARRSRKS